MQVLTGVVRNVLRTRCRWRPPSPRLADDRSAPRPNSCPSPRRRRRESAVSGRQQRALATRERYWAEATGRTATVEADGEVLQLLTANRRSPRRSAARVDHLHQPRHQRGLTRRCRRAGPGQHHAIGWAYILHLSAVDRPGMKRWSVAAKAQQENVESVPAVTVCEIAPQEKPEVKSGCAVVSSLQTNRTSETPATMDSRVTGASRTSPPCCPPQHDLPARSIPLAMVAMPAQSALTQQPSCIFGLRSRRRQKQHDTSHRARQQVDIERGLPGPRSRGASRRSVGPTRAPTVAA